MPNIIQEPGEEIITLEDLKSFLRINNSKDDKLILALIKAARKTIEQFTNKVFLTQEQEFSVSGRDLNFFQNGELNNSHIVINLPVSPIQKINSVVVRNGSDEIKLDKFYLINTGSVYKAVVDSNLIYYSSFVKINYTAGFRAIENVPEPLKVATIMLVNDLYTAKESSYKKGIREGIESIIRPYKAVTI